MTRDAIGSRSVVERVGWRAEERIARVIGGPLTFGDRHALVGRHVGAGLLLPPADQPAVLVRTGEDVVDQLLVVEDPELPPFIEPTGITRRAQRSPDPRQRREHFATVGGADLTVGSIVHGLRSEEHTSEEHTSELQSLMRISYAVFCLKKTTTE